MNLENIANESENEYLVHIVWFRGHEYLNLSTICMASFRLLILIDSFPSCMLSCCCCHMSLDGIVYKYP